MSNADRYAKVVYWSEEDHCFIGCCPRFVIGGCHGDDPKKVFAELCDIVAEAVKRSADEIARTVHAMDLFAATFPSQVDGEDLSAAARTTGFPEKLRGHVQLGIRVGTCRTAKRASDVGVRFTQHEFHDDRSGLVW